MIVTNQSTDTKRNFNATSTRNRIMASTMSVDEYFDELIDKVREDYGKTTSMTLRQIHPEARRMVSHNRKWVYVYHIEASFVIVDRILPAKMNKG